MPVYKNEFNRAGDFLIHVESLEYCCESAHISNKTGGPDITLDNMVAYPVISDGYNGYQFAEQGDEASVVGLIVRGPAVTALEAEALTEDEYLVLVRGPAIINEDQLPTKDHAGDDFTMATLKTALKNLDFVLRKEPVKKSVHYK